MSQHRRCFTKAAEQGNHPMNKGRRKMVDVLKNQARALKAELPVGIGQIVLVLQGGGALGAYQVGVYQALHEAGIEPDWVIGTSIGAINASIIAGNQPAERMSRLQAFWQSVEHGPFQQALGAMPLWGRWHPSGSP